MDKAITKEEQRQQLIQASLRTRDQSMLVNQEFDQIEDDFVEQEKNPTTPQT